MRRTPLFGIVVIAILLFILLAPIMFVRSNGPSGSFEKYSSIGDLMLGLGAYYSQGQYVSTLCLGVNCLTASGVILFFLLPLTAFAGFLLRWSFPTLRAERANTE